MEQQEIEDRLASLTHDDAKNWIVIGRLLLDLEAHSRADPAGHPWQDVVRRRLEELDASISSGHIYKIRRAVGFLTEHAPDALSPENPSPPKISAIEVAERLYRLDPDAGKKALSDVVGQNPVTYVELQKRYNDALEANPEMKSPRQAAWEIRRQADKVPGSEARGTAAPLHNASEEGMSGGSDQYNSEPSPILRRKHEELLLEVWTEGHRAAEQKYAAEVSALQNTIEAQAKELAAATVEIQDLENEIVVLAKQIRELRGYYPEDFE